MTNKKKGITIGSILLLFVVIIIIVSFNSNPSLGSDAKAVDAGKKVTEQNVKSSVPKKTSVSALSEKDFSSTDESSTAEKKDLENAASNSNAGNLNMASGRSTGASSNDITESGNNTSAPKPASSSSSSSANSNPNAGKTWHDAITKQEWVQTSEPWTEYKDRYEYHDICVCGYNLSANGVSFRNHVTSSSDPAAHGSYKTDVAIKVGTDAIAHDGKGYYKTVVVKEAGYY